MSTASDVLPECQRLRTPANALKKHTIDNLDYYIEQFERQVNAHGGKVVYCKDGDDVADFILGLAKEKEARLIVKSKSMTTEEIDFNERLEHHGLESVETDLGEYIIQLAHLKPYHIVAPALQMTRFGSGRRPDEEPGRRAGNRDREARRRSRAPCCARKFLAKPISVSAARTS